MDPLTGLATGPGASGPAPLSAAAAGAPGTTGALSSDFETFLRMLTTQMRNQDPLNPVESADFAVQLATFSSVEQQVQTNALLSGLGTQMATLGMGQFPGWIGLEAEARALVYGFWLRHTRGWGRVRAKLACSLDGRTAMASGESQWITGPAARADVQRLRAASGAIVTGVGTVLADDCSLTVREAGFAHTVGEAALNGRQPLRVVLDSDLRTPAQAKVLQGDGETLLLHREGAAPAGGASFEALPAAPGGGLDLQAMVHALAARAVNEILVESGPRLAGALLAAGLVDELIVYQAPCLLGSAGRPLVELPLARMADKVPLALTDQRRVGDDWRLTFTLRRND